MLIKIVEFPPATADIVRTEDLAAELGKEVTLHGYLRSRSDISKKLSFAQLEDPSLQKSIQLISSTKTETQTVKDAFDKLRKLELNSPVAVRGLVRSRDEKAASKDQRRITNVEIELQDIKVLNDWPRDVIFSDGVRFPPEARHLQIRTDESLRHALHFRAKAASLCRKEMEHAGFTEIETPILFKSTPEGAREFVVPTRTKGLAYALPQSPQQYKQILMASGIPRYYQLARCFRDEDRRADRQPEFTQLDLEMSFATSKDVMRVIEKLLVTLWKELLGVNLQAPFRKMSYTEAMSKYGVDKPDLRIGHEIIDISHLVPADLVSKITPDYTSKIEAVRLKISSDPKKTQEFIGRFLDQAESRSFHDNPQGGPGIFIYSSQRPLSGLQSLGFEAAERIEELLTLQEGDLLIVQARKDEPFSGGSTALGRLVSAVHTSALSQGLATTKSDHFEFLWVNDFPLFTPTSATTDPGQGGTAGLLSTHHPFTAPKTSDDVDLLLTDPLKVTADHYDIVVNGVELGGGSRRIHSASTQEYVLREILKVTPERLREFEHLIRALHAGCPPHAGLALGFDRLIAVMLGRNTVRDVIAFPKFANGEDLLVGSPSLLSDETMETYHLKFSA
jgi:aspartyl-tRNA synthetase